MSMVAVAVMPMVMMAVAMMVMPMVIVTVVIIMMVIVMVVIVAVIVAVGHRNSGAPARKPRIRQAALTRQGAASGCSQPASAISAAI